MIDISEIKITRVSRKSVAIVIHSSGQVEVKAPKYVPMIFIKQFIKSKSEWIEERQKEVLKRKKPSKQFVNGEKFLLLGKEYSLKLGPYIHIETNGDELLFPLALAKRGRDAIEKWYIKQAKAVIKPLVEEYSKVMGTSYNAISFSDTKSKWGSCTHDNRLQFNWRLVMTPLLVVRYVVIHELAHTTEKNHSVIFWSKVRKQNPSYKQQVLWLKKHGDTLKF